jgi:tyrosine-protein kinase Etk/Wzc
MQIVDPMASSTVPPPTPTFSSVVLLGLLRERRRFILKCSLGVGVALLAVSFFLRDSFKAVAIVLPPDKNTNTLAMLAGAASGGGASGGAGALAALTMKNPVDLYVALMSSPSVEDAIIKQFGLQKLYRVKHLSQARKAFEHNSEIKADAKSGLISIAVTDHDPNRAAQMANAIVAEYDKTAARLAITDAQRSRLFFGKQVEQTKDDLAKAEEALRATSEKTGVMQPEGDARALIAYEAQLRAKIAAQTVQIDSMKVYLSDENPQVQTARRELQALQAQAGSMSQKIGGDAAFSSRTVQTEASLDYLRKYREVRYQETLFELLLKNLELAKLDEAREGNIVQIVEVATPPDMKDGPHRTFFLAGGIVLGFLLSFAWELYRFASRQGNTSISSVVTGTPDAL